MNKSLEKTLCIMVYGSLMVLVVGLLTSTTILALSHILMAVPIIYFTGKADYKSFSKSAWALLAMAIIIILSVLFNQDIAVKGYTPLFKSKYFLIGFLSIVPINWYFKENLTDKKISYLLYTFCCATTIASISGLCGTFFGINLLTMESVPIGGRYGGFFGMVMNYAHNMSYFLIVITGLLFFNKEVKHLIDKKFLIAIFIINLVGFYFSYTRGAWLGFLIGVPFFFFKNNKRTFIAVALGMLLIGAFAYFASGQAMYRKDNDQTRVMQWKAATYAFVERPILGYGYLNFENKVIEIKKRYHLGSYNFSGHAHNNFFEMLGSTGVLGFIAFLLWLGFWFKEMFDRSDLVARIGLPFIVVFVVGGLTQSTISLGINLFFIMSAFSISQAVARPENNDKKHS